MYRRGKLCCCDTEKFVHRFTLATIAVDLIMIVVFAGMYFDLIFAKSSFSSFVWVYRDGALTPDQVDIVAKNFAWILSFIYFVLIAKVYFGIRAIAKRFTKAVFMSYYVMSWTFYGSGITQFTIMLAVSWSLLKTWVCVLGIVVLLSFIPAWLFMNIHMKLITK